MVLVHRAHFAAMQRNATTAHLQQVAATEDHGTTAGAFAQVDQLEQGALAGAGVAGDEQHLAFFDLETHVHQRRVAAGVLFADAFESQHAHAAIMPGRGRRGQPPHAR